MKKLKKVSPKVILIADLVRIDLYRTELRFSFNLVWKASSSVTSENSIVSRIFSFTKGRVHIIRHSMAPTRALEILLKKDVDAPQSELD